MTRPLISFGLSAVVLGLAAGHLSGQAVMAPAVAEQVTAAKAAAGDIWPGAYGQLCSPLEQPAPVVAANAPARGQGRGRGAGGPGTAGAGRQAAAPPMDQWYDGPVKIFDNVYLFSTKGGGYGGVTSYAINTSAGIILIDATYDYSVKEEVEGNLKKVGLDPRNIKALFITHGHGDHFGGAMYLQELYSPHVYMSATDWDLMLEQAQAGRGQMGQPVPQRDVTVTDGQKFTLGDLTMTIYLTPGHTPGTISFLIPVVSNGQKHVALFWGGTAIGRNSDARNLASYSESARRMAPIAAQAGVDVILSNHDAFGEYRKKIQASLDNPGKNGFVVGPEAVKRFLSVLDHCAQANLAAK
jgi:metallo-beta-lactamase class B